MRIVSRLFLWAIVAVPFAVLGQRPESRPLSYFEQHLLARSPALEALRQQVEARSWGPAQVQWDAPMVDFMAMPGRWLSGNADLDVTFRQALPPRGLLPAERQEREAMAEAEQWRYAATLIEARADVRIAYVRVLGMQRDLAVLDSLLADLAFFQDVATSRFAAGRSSLARTLQLPLETERILLEREAMQEALQEEWGMLLRTSGLPQEPLHPIADTTFSAPPLAVPDFSALPEVRAMDAEVDALQAAIRMREAMRRIQPTAGLGVNLSALQSGEWSMVLKPSLGVMVPIRRTGIEAGVQEAVLDAASRETTRLAMLLALETQWNTLHAQRQTVEERLLRLESSLLPQLEDALQATRLDFERGEVSLLELLDLFRMQREAQRAQIQAYTRLQELHIRLLALQPEPQQR